MAQWIELTPLGQSERQMVNADRFAAFSPCESGVLAYMTGGGWAEKFANTYDEVRALLTAEPAAAPPVEAPAADVVDALVNLMGVINKAGLLNLSSGVQLGPTVWFVKATEAMEYAAKTLAAARSVTPPAGEVEALREALRRISEIQPGDVADDTVVTATNRLNNAIEIASAALRSGGAA